MATNSVSDPDYERSDADIRLVAALGGVLAAFLFIVPFALLAAYPQSAEHIDPIEPQAAAGPGLLRDPQSELASFRRKEEGRLSSYGWSDQQKQVVHIPIDRALTLIEERGLPGWTQ
jgi:hypothetical protein